MYINSVARTLQIVLKALNNRKHIYVVNLTDSYTARKAREKAQQETEGKYAPAHSHSIQFNVFQFDSFIVIAQQYNDIVCSLWRVQNGKKQQTIINKINQQQYTNECRRTTYHSCPFLFIKVNVSVHYMCISVCVPQRLCRKRKLTGSCNGCRSWMRRSMKLWQRRQRSVLSSNTERSLDRRKSGTD